MNGRNDVFPSSPLTTMTVLLAGLVTVTSLLGLLAPWPYAMETASWKLQAQGQDLGNLLAVVVLLVGVAAARRGSSAGFQAWLGALLYLAYALVIYAFSVHFGRLFLGYVAALGLAAYALMFGLAQARDAGVLVPHPGRAACGVVGSIAGLFAMMWLAAIIPALVAGQVPQELAETGLVSNPVHVLDLALVLPAMLVTVVLARRGVQTARLLVAPWLVFAALMGASIIASMFLAAAPPLPIVILALVTGISAVTAVMTLRVRGRAHLRIGAVNDRQGGRIGVHGGSIGQAQLCAGSSLPVSGVKSRRAVGADG